jgi:hypothetical protein
VRVDENAVNDEIGTNAGDDKHWAARLPAGFALGAAERLWR